MAGNLAGFQSYSLYILSLVSRRYISLLTKMADNVVSIVTSFYGLGVPGFEYRQWQDFILSKNPDSIWGPPRILFNWYRGTFVTAKRLEREINHSPPSSGEVKNEWSYTSTPPVPLNSFVQRTWRTLTF